jgi:hypothetical protein
VFQIAGDGFAALDVGQGGVEAAGAGMGNAAIGQRQALADAVAILLVRGDGLVEQTHRLLGRACFQSQVGEVVQHRPDALADAVGAFHVEGALVVVAGADIVAERRQGVAEIGQHRGRAAEVAQRFVDLQRFALRRQRFRVQAAEIEGDPEVGLGAGIAGLLLGIAGQGDGAFELDHGLVVTAALAFDRAEVDPCGRFAHRVVQLLCQRQCLLRLLLRGLRVRCATASSPPRSIA